MIPKYLREQLLDIDIDTGNPMHVSVKWGKVEKSFYKLKEMGLVKNNDFFSLNEDGIKMAKEIQDFDRKEREGIPIENRIKQKPVISDKKLEKEIYDKRFHHGWYVDEIDEEKFYSDGHVMLKGEPFVFYETQNIDMKKIIPEGDFKEIFPKTFSKNERVRYIWWDDNNQLPIDEKYFDYIIKKHPNVRFFAEKRESISTDYVKPIKLYEDNNFIGLIMPLRVND